MSKSIQDIIISINSKETNFDSIVWDVYNYQREQNFLYQEFLKLVGKFDIYPTKISEIPFCPIAIFKYREVKSGYWTHCDQMFKSSGTGGGRSTHMVHDIDLYHSNAVRLFENQFGEINDFQFVGLLPNYHSNNHSSLISMVNKFMNLSDYDGMFCLDDYAKLNKIIERNKSDKVKTVLFGVSFALLDYVQHFTHSHCDDLIVIETGGMKKFKKELTKNELHESLRMAFSGATICSEYGMTECLSQLYSTNSSALDMNDRMRIVITDPLDPFNVLNKGSKGRINIIDLANIHSLSFIATDDIGYLTNENRVEVLGRLDNSELRGCNYLI